jgi:hypothetical protein
MSRKLKRYMVGYDDDNQTIYGKDEDGDYRFADPFTLAQAAAQVKRINKLAGWGRAMTIYKLVPVRRANQTEHAKEQG